MGLRVAPFKSQNMALNSFVTPGGAEIGRAQALQAEAARIAPRADFNPILLKPTGDRRSQVIIHGKVHGDMNAVEYHRFKPRAMEYVMESYRRLAAEFDIIVIEGAGSPAEINLREGDIANMGLATRINAPVLLVGDIDRGGVFASLLGTMELLEADERELIKGLIINRFRGDPALLDSGVNMIEARIDRPVLGVVPYFSEINLPDEDGVALERPKQVYNEGSTRVVVIRLPRISNFTDFDALSHEPGIVVEYINGPPEASLLDGASLVIIPGSKNVVSDLRWMKENGLSKAIGDYYKKGGTLFGICGGLQILGRSIADPDGVEGASATIEGLSLLALDTILEKEKATCQVEGDLIVPDLPHSSITGYEIHMGRSTSTAKPFATILKRNGEGVSISDGGVSECGRVMGTYIHGIFDNDGFRRALLKRLGFVGGETTPFAQAREDAIADFSSLVKESLDIDAICDSMGFDTGLGVARNV